MGGFYNNLYNPFIVAELYARGLLGFMRLRYLAFLSFFAVCSAIGTLFQCFIYKREMRGGAPSTAAVWDGGKQNRT